MLGFSKPPDLSPLESFFVIQPPSPLDRLLHWLLRLFWRTSSPYASSTPRDLVALHKAANTVTSAHVKITGTVAKGLVDDPEDSGAHLTLTHRAMDQTLSKGRIRISAKGSFEVPVHLLRGRNLISIESSGESARALDVDLFHRTGLGEWIDSILRALVLVLVVKTYVVQAFYIPTPSMETTLLGHPGIHDYILVEKVSYLFRPPHAGEIVVFQYPIDPTKDFIKRMVAGQGDTVEVEDKRLSINGHPLDEPYTQWIGRPGEDGIRDHFGPQTIPDGEIFCMGDNRDNSRDSRWWGALPLWRMIGKAWGIYYPLDRWRILKHHLGKPMIGPEPPPSPNG